MKPTGIVRPMDDAGRIVLPVEIRKTLRWRPGDPIEILADEESVMLRRYQPGCVFCGEVKGLTTFKERRVCKWCRKEMAQDAL